MFVSLACQYDKKFWNEMFSMANEKMPINEEQNSFFVNVNNL